MDLMMLSVRRLFKAISVCGFVAACLLSASWAQATAGVDPQQWTLLLNRIAAKGQIAPTNGGARRTLVNIAPTDLTKSHQADYVSEIGGISPKGVFVAQKMNEVSETWTLQQDGNWQIDQWLFEMQLDGTLTGAQHLIVVQTDSAEVLSDDDGVCDGPTGPISLAKYNDRLQMWYQQVSINNWAR